MKLSRGSRVSVHGWKYMWDEKARLYCTEWIQSHIYAVTCNVPLETQLRNKCGNLSILWRNQQMFPIGTPSQRSRDVLQMNSTWSYKTGQCSGYKNTNFSNFAKSPLQCLGLEMFAVIPWKCSMMKTTTTEKRSHLHMNVSTFSYLLSFPKSEIMCCAC